MKVPGSFWIVAVCATYLFTPSCAPAQAVPANSAEVRLHSYLEQAAQAMHTGALATAAENFRRALGIDPHSLAALNNLGIVLSRQGKPAEAIPLKNASTGEQQVAGKRFNPIRLCYIAHGRSWSRRKCLVRKKNLAGTFFSSCSISPKSVQQPSLTKFPML
jgi:tetratricopeptide (TPR) repeat protein